MDAASGYGHHFSLKVLVLAVVPIRKSEFAKHLELLKQHSRIALADIPPPSGGSSTILSTLLPTPVSRGFLNLSFVTEWDQSQGWLEEFQIHRKVHAVLGILDCTEWQDEAIGEGLHDGARRFQDLVAQLAPRDVSARRCYAFNPGEAHKDNTDGMVVIPNVGDLGFYLGTLLAELASGILAGLSRAMVSLDSRLYIATPKERPGMSHIAGAPSPGPRQSQDNRLSLPDPTIQSKSPHIIAGSSTDRLGSPVGQSRPASMIVESTDAKSRKRLPGRLSKLRGDIYCLAGRISEGLACYSEAISATRSTGDIVWQAIATEASLMAQIYQSWSVGQPLARNSLAQSRRPSLAELAKQPAETAIFHNPNLGKELPAQFATVFDLYARSTTRRSSATMGADGQLQLAPAIAEGEDTLHPLLLTESYVRYIRFQMAMLLNAAVWNQAVIGLIIGLRSPTWPIRTQIQLFQYGLNGAVNKSDTLGSVSVAYSHACDPALSIPERIQFLSDFASVYERLYCPRRQASIQRELSALMAHNLSRQKAHAETMPLTAPTGDIADGLPERPPTVVRNAPDTTENTPILLLSEKACTVYGVNVVAISEIVGERQASLAITRSEAGMLLVNLESVQFGWGELQLAAVKDAIAASQALSDYQGAIRFTITALRELAGVMTSHDQLRYSQSIPRLFGAATKRGNNFQMAYWGPKNLVMSIEVASLQPSQLPYKIPSSELRDSTSIATAAIDLSDRVYHSTAAKPLQDNSKAVLVQNELAEFYVTLQNPFLFDLDIEQIAISTSGVPCEVNTLSSVIPSSSFHTIRLSCTPLATGDLHIRGCKIRIFGCAEREFVVPLADNSSVVPPSLTVQTAKTRIKQRAQALAQQAAEPPSTAAETGENYLTCEVVASQPNLRLRHSNLKHDSLVLYDGQRTTLRLTVENTSDLDINWLRLKFTDSCTDALRAYLGLGEASDIEIYELEREAIEQPAVQCRNSKVDIEIPARTVKILDFICTGKPRLTAASIQVDYASVNASEAEVKGSFLCRRLDFPLRITVNSSIACRSIDILPVATAVGSRERSRHARSLSVTSIGKALAVDSQLEDGLSEMDRDTDALLVVEIHNESLIQTFEVTLSTKDGSGGRIKAQIDPDASFNLLLPVNRLTLSAEPVARPIPSLSNKQFVLGKDKSTQLEKEMFWYREALLSNLQLTWRETSTRTSGEIWLQDAEFTEAMLSAIKLDEFAVDFILTEDGTELQMDERRIWCTACEAFYEAKVSLRDRRDRKSRLTATLSPQHDNGISTLFDAQITPLPAFNQSHADDTMETDFLSRQIITDGTKAVPLRPLDPGKPDEGMEASFPLCFLSSGMFELCLRVHDEAGHVVVTRTLHFDVQ